MPRKPTTSKEIIIRVSHEQHQALLLEAEAAGYIVLESGTMSTKGSVSEFVRDHLERTIPAFGQAEGLPARGKYPRKRKSAPGASGHV